MWNNTTSLKFCVSMIEIKHHWKRLWVPFISMWFFIKLKSVRNLILLFILLKTIEYSDCFCLHFLLDSITRFSFHIQIHDSKPNRMENGMITGKPRQTIAVCGNSTNKKRERKKTRKFFFALSLENPGQSFESNARYGTRRNRTQSKKSGDERWNYRKKARKKKKHIHTATTKNQNNFQCETLRE